MASMVTKHMYLHGMTTAKKLVLVTVMTTGTERIQHDVNDDQKKCCQTTSTSSFRVNVPLHVL